MLQLKEAMGPSDPNETPHMPGSKILALDQVFLGETLCSAVEWRWFLKTQTKVSLIMCSSMTQRKLLKLIEAQHACLRSRELTTASYGCLRKKLVTCKVVTGLLWWPRW